MSEIPFTRNQISLIAKSQVKKENSFFNTEELGQIVEKVLGNKEERIYNIKWRVWRGKKGFFDEK